MIDFNRAGAEREEPSSARCTRPALPRPRCTAATQHGPWTDIYAIGACIYPAHAGFTLNDAPQQQEDRLSLSLSARVYSDNLIRGGGWCMSLDRCRARIPVFALQRARAPLHQAQRG